jgi:hypothetical protein
VKAHQKLFEGVIDAMSPLFKEDADVFSILHSVFTTLLDFAIRVYNKDLEDNETNRLLVFKVLYYTMMPYFKENIQKNARFLK